MMQAEAGQDLQVVLEDLTPAERVAFEVALASGELARLLLPWEPWWRSAKACNLSLSTAGTRLIQEHAQSSIGMLLQLTCRHPHFRYAKNCHGARRFLLRPKPAWSPFMSLQSFQGISAKSVSMQKCGSSCACLHRTIPSVKEELQ